MPKFQHKYRVTLRRIIEAEVIIEANSPAEVRKSLKPADEHDEYLADLFLSSNTYTLDEVKVRKVEEVTQ